MTAVNKTFKTAAQFTVHTSQAAHQQALTDLAAGNTTIIRGGIYQAIMAANVSATVKGAVALLNVVDSVSASIIVPPVGCTSDTCEMRATVNLQVSDPRVTTPFPNVQTLIGTLKPQTAVTGALAAALRGAVFGTTPGYNVTFHDMLPVGKELLCV